MSMKAISRIKTLLNFSQHLYVLMVVILLTRDLEMAKNRRPSSLRLRHGQVLGFKKGGKGGNRLFADSMPRRFSALSNFLIAGRDSSRVSVPAVFPVIFTPTLTRPPALTRRGQNFGTLASHVHLEMLPQGALCVGRLKTGSRRQIRGPRDKQ